ncbi:uncharacterized protein MONBRDRAFT_35825 [Monosiga brevicollis MX1]|uniref:STIM1/2 Orai1-activating region domain-containing protein n=1 Tax=Monosiga brevicollis TaxID=81824 RepID=A9US15_MONBE|nr:uncharacterized protein MONBRDRAFT_35825 [Monosiga brevicollis MX1]EDQ91700.1 predicted protein [Monosiga brevicollis MX1]|eukprot:XP_001742986.1 hypothetical protein [Monosiga brevicollis MX1]
MARSACWLWATLIALGSASVARGPVTPGTSSTNAEMQAISLLHSSIDYNRDGVIDEAETAGILKDAYMSDEDTSEFLTESHEYFQLDALRDLREIYEAWLANPARNWTVQEVAEWALREVGSVDTARLLREAQVNGTPAISQMLPMLATNDTLLKNFALSAQTRARLKIRSMDIILFGPPPSDLWQYAIVAVSILLALSSLLLLAHHLRQSKALAQELERLKSDSDELTTMRGQMHEVERFLNDNRHEGVRQLEAENRRLSGQLDANARDLIHQCFERETALFKFKAKSIDERQQEVASEYEKLTNRRGALFNLRMAHSTKPHELELAMTKIKADMAALIEEGHERRQRWSQIQDIFKLNLQPRRSSSANSKSTHSEHLRRRATGK